ncbi:MAG TPA: BON domain-containing protein [Vicinamibacterales bacterium]|jgi:hyperosmotically inducible protein|nr:BON domain-containing protein [Vicinamibacterales bacterium]
MRAVVGSVFVLAALVAIPAPAGAATPQAAMSADHNLDERIENRLSTSTLKKYDIKVSVTNSVATLTGTVRTEADRRKASQLATIKGISRVENQLVIDESAPTGTTGRIKSTVKEGAEKTKEGAEVVADKTKEGLSKTGEVITDSWITTRVHSKFVGEDLLKDSDISVETNDHVVTLKGTVMSAAGRARAVEQAREVEGVHRVIDQLRIGPKK